MKPDLPVQKIGYVLPPFISLMCEPSDDFGDGDDPPPKFRHISVTVIAAEYLVTGITAQTDGHVLPCQAAHQDGGDRAGV